MPDKDGNVTFGVVGLGMGRNRSRVVTQTEGAKLVAVCDLVEDKAKAVAEELSCDSYTDYEKMLGREDIDVIYVMTESGNHCKHGIMAAQAGKHVVSTKPLGTNCEQVDALIAACTKAGVKLVTDFEARYFSHYLTLCNAVHSGALGNIMVAEARLKWFRSQGYYDHNHGWRGTWGLDGGGTLANQTVHFIDQLLWIIGDVKSVYAHLACLNHKIEAADLGMVFLEFKNGVKGSIMGTTTFPKDCYAGVEIHGDKGAVLTTRKGMGQSSECEWIWADGCEIDPETLHVEPEIKSAAADMVHAIKLNCEPMVPGEEGRRTVALLDAIRKSHETRQVVNL